jgi:hypothetical protein
VATRRSRPRLRRSSHRRSWSPNQGLCPAWNGFVGTGRWEAVGSASTQIGERRRHLTMLVKVILGNWQLVYQHVG